MEKMRMESLNLTSQNIEKIEALFPNCITESRDENGQLKKSVNFKMLKQMLSEDIVDGEEAYEFTWVGKKESIVEANKPIRKTLRPAPEESVDWDNTENLYIEGDNLEVLKLLQESYLGKVKMIYIDPPYNTGNDFIYNDDFKVSNEEYAEKSGEYDEYENRMFKNTDSNVRFHSDWCSMMYSRLLVAKNLLREDGVIFISIDDNEVENLKKICDEVFGEGNFIGLLSVENNPKGRKNSKFISVSSEYCLIYSKDKNLAYFIENIPKNASDMKLDEDGKYVHGSGKRVLVGEDEYNNLVTNTNSNKNYSVYYNRESKKIKLKNEHFGEEDYRLLSQGYKKYFSYRGTNLVENTYSKEKFLELYREGALEFSTEKIYEKNFSDKIRMKSQLVNKKYEAIVDGIKEEYSLNLTTTGAGTELKELFGTSNTIFSASKNIGFINLLISLLDEKEFIILDFFSGSATTAHATMKLNALDGGKRKYILVQLPENLYDSLKNASSLTKKVIETALEYLTKKNKTPYITEIAKERIRLAGDKIKSENPLLTSDLDIGFRVLKVDSSNMKDVYYAPNEITQDFLSSLESNIKEDRTDLDLLFGCLLEWGLSLSLPYKSIEIDGCMVHNYNEGDLIACFEENISENVMKEIAKLTPLRAVFRDSSFENSVEKINTSEIFKLLSPNTKIKVI